MRRVHSINQFDQTYNLNLKTSNVAIYTSNMSYQDHNGGYPPPRENESQYPPPPGEEDDRARAYHPHQRNPSAGASNITLPSIAAQYDPQYQPPNGYAQDPRAYGPQDPYRVHQPPPPTHYRDDRQYQGDYGRGSGIPGGQHIPGPGQHMNGGGPGQHMTFNQSAPRQRTAIACRYCRRRKVCVVTQSPILRGADNYN